VKPTLSRKRLTLTSGALRRNCPESIVAATSGQADWSATSNFDAKEDTGRRMTQQKRRPADDVNNEATFGVVRLLLRMTKTEAPNLQIFLCRRMYVEMK
jgi:hypothetical protein